MALMLHGEYGHVGWQMNVTLLGALLLLAGLVWVVLWRHGRGE